MPNDKFMYVYPERDASGKITFLMSENVNHKPSKGSPNPKVALGKHSGNWHFTFSIVNPDGLSVRFTNDPIWAKEVDDPQSTYTCPGKGIATDQIVGVHLPNNSQLEFIDLNKGKERTIVYQLNMENGGVPCPLDPDIRNGGGGGGGTGYYYALVGAGVGLAASFILENAMLDVSKTLLYVVGGAVAGYLVGRLLGRG